MRKILGTIAGVIVAMLVITIVEFALGSAFALHMPDATAPRTDWAAFMAAVPLPAKLGVAGGWFLGTLAGAVTAGLIARSAAACWIVTALVALSGIWNAIEIPHPLWMDVAAVLAPALGGLIAHHLVRGRLHKESRPASG